MSNADKKTANYRFTGELEKRNSSQIHMHGHVKILLRNVRLNGNLLFRDHVWIKDSKIFNKIKIGDVLCFTGKLEYYMNGDTQKKDKLGIVGIRNLKVLKNNKRFIRNDEPYILNKWMKILKTKYDTKRNSKK
jgi:hypothetical protein